MKIIISGLGVMGASLAQAINNSSIDAEIWGYDEEDTIDLALAQKIIGFPVKNWPADCSGADIIFLATPINIIREHLNDLNGLITKETLVTDMGSTKGDLDRFCQEVHFSGFYIGGHPMTGAEKSGITAANPLLYENAIYILTIAAQEINNPVSQKLLLLLQAIKAKVFFLDALTHDKIMALISHLPQLIAVALMNLVGQKNSVYQYCLELAAGGFRDITRIASSPSNIWQDIVNSNKINIHQVLEEFILQLQKEKDDLDHLEKSFSKANEFRSQIPNKNKGFLSLLTNVLVYVNDQKGAIAKLSSCLYNENIDIRDIELLKIREHEGGVFMLSFDNTEAQRAIHVLNEIGYKAFIKE